MNCFYQVSHPPLGNCVYGPAPVRRYLPELIDLTLPLEQVAEGYRAMDERRAIKALLRP